MADQGIPSRRKFVKLCAGAVAAVSTGACTLTRETETLQRFHRVQLVDKKKGDLLPSSNLMSSRVKSSTIPT